MIGCLRCPVRHRGRDRLSTLPLSREQELSWGLDREGECAAWPIGIQFQGLFRYLLAPAKMSSGIFCVCKIDVAVDRLKLKTGV